MAEEENRGFTSVMDTGVPSQLDEDDLRAEIEIELPDSQNNVMAMIEAEDVDGIEITVTILGDRVLPPVAIEAKGAFYDYEAKYLSNETKYSLANLDPDNLITLKNFCWHAFKSLGCEGWGRVDLIKDNNNNFQLIEINTVPGLTETSLVPKSAALEGITFNELILEILHLACAKS